MVDDGIVLVDECREDPRQVDRVRPVAHEVERFVERTHAYLDIALQRRVGVAAQHEGQGRRSGLHLVHEAANVPRHDRPQLVRPPAFREHRIELRGGMQPWCGEDLEMDALVVVAGRELHHDEPVAATEDPCAIVSVWRTHPRRL